MSSFQAITEALLFGAAASRATLQLAAPAGGFAYAAEAVTQGMLQIRHDATGGELPGSAATRQLELDGEIIFQDDLERADPAVPRALIDRFGARAQILSPIVRGGRLAAILAVHHAPGPRQWDADAVEAVRRAQAAALAALEERACRALDTTPEDLLDAALQATLDTLRAGLRVQRCTLRQNVSAAYAFPVTHESRADGVRSLRGDFTIIQSGQPVIERLLRDRAQVVQDDSRGASADPLFHYMLEHYGDMRAQIVTPLFREDNVAAVLSVHNLREMRKWTVEETGLARSAARVLGLLVGARLA